MLPSSLHHLSPGAQRALGICVAALIALGGGQNSYAQSIKRLPNALMPAPGNVGLTLNQLGKRSATAGLSNTDHPLFDSSFTGTESQVLATSRYGNVTSRDLYIWMQMRESPNRAYLPELLRKSQFPKERAELAKALKVEIDDFIFNNYIVPRLLPSAPPDPVYDLKHHVYTLPAWQTVFLLRVVQPGVCITPADRQKYLQEHTAELTEPQRLRTRYIFMNSAETDSAEAQDRVEVEMDELRSSILRGEISFADAARKRSQAPSASRGGEIPPFQHDELFFQFENAAANLEPGQVSEVFRGPRGYYMVQLISVLEPEKPNLDNARQAQLVDEGLSRQVLRAAYDIYMRDMLLERRRILEHLTAWDSLEDGEEVAHVCDFSLSKGQIRSAWPIVEGNDLKLQYDVMATVLRNVMEREAMAQEVAAKGFANDPMLERARWMAGNLIRRDAWMDQLRASLPISEELVRKFWQSHPDLFTPLALKRVIRLTMTPSNTAPLPAQTRNELDMVLAKATGQPMTVAITKREPQDEERNGLVADTKAQAVEAFNMLTNPQSEPNFYTDFNSSQTLEEIMNSPSEDSLPSLNGEPAPGLDSIPGPSAITTDTLNSLAPEKSSPEEAHPSAVEPTEDSTTGTVLDLVSTSTANRGGAAPSTASGGIRHEGIGPEGIVPQAPARPLQPQTIKSEAAATASNATAKAAKPTPLTGPAYVPSRDEDEGGPAGSSEPIVGKSRAARPAVTPTGGAVPVGYGVPKPRQGLSVDPTPNPQNQLPPPPTSNIPYNPNWFYARLNPTEIKSIVGDYASSDWLLTMDDLGFVYVADLQDAPAALEKVPVGAFSRPVVRGQKAISWYIEDARKTEKPGFEEIKTQAYDTYRSVQLDKISAETYNRELEKADVKYKF